MDFSYYSCIRRTVWKGVWIRRREFKESSKQLRLNRGRYLLSLYSPFYKPTMGAPISEDVSKTPPERLASEFGDKGVDEVDTEEDTSGIIDPRKELYDSTEIE